MIDTLIISDLHLGSPQCRAEDILMVLEKKFQTLILLGDVFADLNFERLKKSHWEVLSVLRRKSKLHKIIWVSGNHDEGLLQFGHFLGVEVVEKYEFMVGDKKAVAIHGHQFDLSIINHPRRSKLISWWYLQVQKLNLGFLSLAEKHLDGVYNLSERVMEGAIEYALDNGYEVIVCGHTHVPLEFLGEISYYNCGCWVKPGSFVSIIGEKITLDKL